MLMALTLILVVAKDLFCKRGRKLYKAMTTFNRHTIQEIDEIWDACLQPRTSIKKGQEMSTKISITLQRCENATMDSIR